MNNTISNKRNQTKINVNNKKYIHKGRKKVSNESNIETKNVKSTKCIYNSCNKQPYFNLCSAQ